MTQGNATDAGPVRDRLLACLDERIAGCRGASPGPWRANEVQGGVSGGDGGFWVVRPAAAHLSIDLLHIAQHGPDRMEALYLGLRAEVANTHVVVQSVRGETPYCDACQTDGPDCRFVVALASLLGVGGGVPS